MLPKNASLATDGFASRFRGLHEAPSAILTGSRSSCSSSSPPGERQQQLEKQPFEKSASSLCCFKEMVPFGDTFFFAENDQLLSFQA